MPANIHNREISQIVEGQMRQWEMAQNEQVKRETQTRLVGTEGVKIDYIAISRELGSGGAEIAQALTGLLKWQVYDKEILDYMAENMDVHKSVLESVDERTISWIEDWLAPIFTEKAVRQLDYYRHLTKVLLVIAKHGRATILGRAAGMILPRESGLSVRIIAPFDLRCQRYAHRNNIALDKAKSIVIREDRARKEFAKDFLNADICDCKYYDIVINTEKFSPESAAKLIWRTLDQRTKGTV